MSPPTSSRRRARRKKAKRTSFKKPARKSRTPKSKRKKSPLGRPGSSTRTQARVPMELQVQYRIREKFVVDLANDISPGGIFIKTLNPLPKGTSVELSFGSADGGKEDPRVFVEGKVVWSKKSLNKNVKGRSGMGIEFTRVDIEGQLFIDNLINDFLRKVSIL